MWKFNITIYFLFIVACACSNGLNQLRCLKNSQEHNHAQQNENFKHQDTTLPLPKFVLVTVHGLNMDTSEEAEIKRAVEKRFGKAVEIIQPICREGSISVRLPIDKQAKIVVEEVKTTLHNRYPQYSEEALKALPINIFGYSQGGLVVCIIAANYRDELNIKSLTLAHAPLSGTDVLENSKSDIDAFKAKAKPGLEAIGHPKTSLFQAKVMSTMLNNRWLKGLANWVCKGVRDMRISSDVCKRIKKFLREEKNGIPTLIIAGCIGSLTEYFKVPENKQKDVNVLSQQYAKFTTGKEHGEHDILISTRSQLCRTDSFENLAASSKKDNRVYPENVEIHINHALHCSNLMSIGSGYLVYSGEIFFDSKEEIDHYVNFLANHNNLDGNAQTK